MVPPDYSDFEDDLLDPFDADQDENEDSSPHVSTSIAHQSAFKMAQSNLAHAFTHGRTAQAYLIVGAVKESGYPMATWIGHQLLCENPDPTKRPCGLCAFCRQVSAHAFADMHWYEPEKVSRTIDAQMMRERIIPQAIRSAMCGSWKIMVISWANRMNETAANALLKTLEEPPAKTLFVLLADSTMDLLPTIISRCQVIDLGRDRQLAEPYRTKALDALAAYDIKPSVAGNPIQANALSGIFCGILGTFQKTAEVEIKQENKANASVIIDDAALKARIVARYKDMREDLIQLIGRWMQDLIRIKAAKTDEVIPLYYPLYREVLTARAKRYPLAKLLENPSLLQAFVSQLDRNMYEVQILPYWIDRFFI